MLKARTPLIVGLLVIGAVAAFIYVFGSIKTGIDPETLYTVYARFDDASGLAPESRIVVAGIEVGKLGTPVLDPRTRRARVPALRQEGRGAAEPGVWDRRRTSG
ncbi:MAG: MlaD family protein [Myxococcota bacterium]